MASSTSRYSNDSKTLAVTNKTTPPTRRGGFHIRPLRSLQINEIGVISFAGGYGIRPYSYAVG